MKISAVGDIHGLHHNIIFSPQTDLILCAGDLTEHGTESEMNSFIRWLAKQKADHKIIIAGNHDHCLAKNSERWKKEFARSGITYLCNQMVELEGLTIYGSPYIPISGNWSFQKNAGSELQQNWQQIPPSCDILLTHGPPFGILDLHHHEHIGDKDLYQCCQKRLPKYHFFGHVHSGYGHMKSTLTTYINCSCKKFLNKGPFTPPIWQVKQ